MPPPILPKAAHGLAIAVSDTVIDITRRQDTSVSTSDVIRGVHEALRRNLTVVDYEIALRVCDAAHARAVHGDGHTTGFCRACALTYEAVNVAVDTYRMVPADDT